MDEREPDGDRATGSHRTTRRTRGFGALFAAGLLAGSAWADSCSADCADPAKACLCLLDPADAAVSLTPFGTLERRAARAGQALNVGDQLMNLDPDNIVEVICPDGSEIKLHGRFHAIVQPTAEGLDCAFNIMAGNADVLGVKPTGLEAGEVTMGSVTTQYSMRVWRDADDVNVECTVFEGEVLVRNAAGWSSELRDGAKVSWDGGSGGALHGRIAETDVDAASLVYARMDLARLRSRGDEPAEPETLLAQLGAAYRDTLAAPRDARARIELAALQTDLRNSTQALFHLEHAEELQQAERLRLREARERSAQPGREPAQSREALLRLEAAQREQEAVIAAMKYVAFARLEREAEAAREIERVRRLDQAQYDSIRQADPAQQDFRSVDPSLERIRPSTRIITPRVEDAVNEGQVIRER